MPCSVSREEELWYETEGNFKDYGKKVTNLHLINAVACELADLVCKNKLESSLSRMSLTWLQKHQQEDLKISQQTKSENERVLLKKQALNKLSAEDKKILGL
jgi:hypothetical protein